VNAPPAPAAPVDQVGLAPGVDAWFTGRPGGNLAHRRPHLPSALGRARRRLAATIGVDTDQLHLMRQVHGAAVGVVDETTPPGAELRDVDVLVTELADRALVVQVADCVPLLLGADDGPIAAVHAGRVGIAAGVVDAALDALAARGAGHVRAALGPAIGACCYEVPAEMRDAFVAEHPAAAAETTEATPALDLPAAVRTVLEHAGVAVVADTPGCTACAPDRWFSHRRDPGAGRQVGVVVRRGAP
jgi:polyphenol oxidase